MTLIRLGLFAFLLPSLLGFLLWESAQTSGKRNHWESLAFAFPIGWGAIASFMLLLANLGFRLEWITLALLASFVSFAAMIYIALTTNRQSANIGILPNEGEISSKRTWIWWIFLGVVGLELCLITASFLHYPYITDWDGWAIWGMKAKAFFSDHGFNGYLGRADDLSFSWPARPCLSSIFQTYVYLAGGQANEAASRFVHLVAGISLLSIFYWTLRRRLPATTAMIWTAMLATMPNLADQVTAGIGNILLAIFLFSAVSALDRYRTEGTVGYLIAASAFLGFALLTRDEAFSLCAICVAIALLFAPCPQFTSRKKIILQTLAILVGAAFLYSLWMRLISPYHIYDLCSVWLTSDLPHRIHQHLRDLGKLLPMILAEFAKPSQQAIVSPVEKLLGVSLFWIIFAAVFMLIGVPSILKRLMTPFRRQNELATICGLCAALGLIAYCAGLWLFPYTNLNDFEFWCNVLDRHILSLVPLAACHIALSLSSDPQGLSKPASAMIVSGKQS
jgi:hypothetical protein